MEIPILVTWTGFSREHHQPGRKLTGFTAGARGDGSRDRATVGWSVGVSSRKKQLGLEGSGTRYADTRLSGTANGWWLRPTSDLDPLKERFLSIFKSFFPLKIKRINQV